MDPEDVARLVAELKLSAKAEDTTINITKEVAENKKLRWRKVLVGKIFDNKIVNRDTLRVQVPRILQCQRPPEIEIVGDNLFVAVFALEEDKKHVLVDGPWHFFNSLMSFKAPQGLQDPSEVKFEEITLWAQCHNLPVACMNPVVIRKIGEQIGKVEEIDTGEGGQCLGQFARIRITRLLNEPLKRCVNIKDDGEKAPRLILLKYERLPDFCHACGRIGHVLRHCEDEEADKKVLGYGNWMKAIRVAELRRQREPGRSYISGLPNQSRRYSRGGRVINKGRGNNEVSGEERKAEGTIVINEKGNGAVNMEQEVEEESFREEITKLTEGEIDKGKDGSERKKENKDNEEMKRMNTEMEEKLGINDNTKSVDKIEKKKWKKLARERVVRTKLPEDDMGEEVVTDRKRSANLVSLTPSMISDKRSKWGVKDNEKMMAITTVSAEQNRRAQ